MRSVPPKRELDKLKTRPSPFDVSQLYTYIHRLDPPSQKPHQPLSDLLSRKDQNTPDSTSLLNWNIQSKEMQCKLGRSLAVQSLCYPQECGYTVNVSEHPEQCKSRLGISTLQLFVHRDPTGQLNPEYSQPHRSSGMAECGGLASSGSGSGQSGSRQIVTFWK